MPYTPFHKRFPEIAEKETRAITVFNHPDLPSDTYGLTEAYCDETGCDCRRVFINVISSKQNKLLATIAFGWENKKYYAKWMGDNDPSAIEELKGPALNLASPQSALAPALLNQIKVVLKDRSYIERLRRHYKLFKDDIKKKNEQRIKRGKTGDLYDDTFPSKIVGRNAPCPCGSGKKYKKCCLG